MSRKRQVQKSGVSPYVRHSKMPYKYSEAYYRWHSAVKGGQKGTVSDAARDHDRQFMNPMRYSNEEIMRSRARREGWYANG